LAKNSSFGFSALAFVSAKTKCAVCAAGFFQYETQRDCVRKVAVLTAIIFEYLNNLAKKQ
jgi:hypothetical protein